MLNVTLDRTMGATPAQVWAVLADFPNIADWNGGVKSSRATGDAAEGVGATRHCDLAPMGTLEETIQEWAPSQRMVISIDSATKIPIRRGLMTFTLAPADDGAATAYRMSYDYEAKGGPFSGFVGRRLQGQLRKGFTGFMDDLETAAKARAVA